MPFARAAGLEPRFAYGEKRKRRRHRCSAEPELGVSVACVCPHWNPRVAARSISQGFEIVRAWSGSEGELEKAMARVQGAACIRRVAGAQSKAARREVTLLRPRRALTRGSQFGHLDETRRENRTSERRCGLLDWHTHLAYRSVSSLLYVCRDARYMFAYLRSSLILAVLGVAAGGAIGWYATGTPMGAANFAFIVAVLAVLEVSLSFDNAVLNATVLQDMDDVWRRRFITWGILIAVVGMRVFLPLLIVAILGNLGPIEAVVLAVTRPDRYAEILTSAHVSVAAFGGAFLAMVGLQFFFDQEKDVHWIRVIEAPLSRLGRIEAVSLGLVLLSLYGMSRYVEAAHQLDFLVAGLFGLVTYIGVDGIGALLKSAENSAEGPSSTGVVARSGLASFLYLEVLDASFSFDGVIGAFALSTNLLVIAIGLGIGAMFVRSLTILFVERGVLGRFLYLEHGAFYAILVLAAVMFTQAFAHIPEAVSGLVGAAVIGFSLWSSIRHNRKHLAKAFGGEQIELPRQTEAKE